MVDSDYGLGCGSRGRDDAYPYGLADGLELSMSFVSVHEPLVEVAQPQKAFLLHVRSS